MLEEPKKQVTIILLSTLVALVSVIAILNGTDPDQSSNVTKTILYLSIFLFSFGIFTLTSLYLRKKLSQQIYVVSLKESVRQSFLVSVFLTLTFFLSSKDLAFWWLELSIVLLLIFVEIFFFLKI